MWKKIKPYIVPYSVAIAIPVGVGLLAARLTKDDMNIYEVLKTPPLSPPGIIFPIVWTVLYILMGVSSAMIYTGREFNPDNAKKGLTYYGASLALNFAWTLIFFKLQAAFFALICLVALLCLIIITVNQYFKVSKWAAYLQIPYVIWVAFAGYLNAGIWLLNQ